MKQKNSYSQESMNWYKNERDEDERVRRTIMQNGDEDEDLDDDDEDEDTSDFDEEETEEEVEEEEEE